jgi:YfiH family protein
MHPGVVRREAGKLVWFEPVEPLGGAARVVMTTRVGGLSQTPYDSLNLGFHVGDVGERVRLNRLAVGGALGRKLLEPVVGDQVHGATVRSVGALHAGTRWQAAEKALAETDGLVTNTPRLPLVTLVADCLPVALVDSTGSAAAVVHAGWRGLAEGVLENAIEAMRETWDSEPSEVVAWLGASIGPCCYEVGPEVALHFPSAVRAGDADRSFFDLRAEARRRLRACGLVEENVTGLELCTSCHPELFFSHRRSTREGGSATGRQALILWLER